MEGRGKFDTYTAFWRDVEPAGEDIYCAQKDCEPIPRPREKEQEELKRAVVDLCRLRCPKCGRKLEEIRYRKVWIDRCTGCGGVWLDPRELEIVAPAEHES